MGNHIAFVPGPRGEGFEELSRTEKGTLYRKHLLRYGTYPHPADPKEKLVIDESVADRLIENFNASVCDIVQVPIVDGDNRHVEDPLRNIGEVTRLTKEEDGVYAYIDVRKEDAAKEIGKTLLGVSAMMHMNYTDTRTGEKVGPTLLHAAITNRPYITGLKDFEPLVAASADNTDDEAVLYGEVLDEEPVRLAEEDVTPEPTQEEAEMEKPTREQLIEMLRDEYEIDVDGLMAQRPETVAASGPSVNDFASQVLEVIKAAGVATSTPDDDATVTVQDVAEAVIELSQEKAAVEAEVASLKAEARARQRIAAEKEVDDLISGGYVLPKQRPVMVELAQNDRDRFQTLVPENPIVDLSERGVQTHDAPDAEKLNEEIARLSALAETTGK